jgi:hypothetical protein
VLRDFKVTYSQREAIAECQRVNLASPDEAAESTVEPLTATRVERPTEGALLSVVLRLLVAFYLGRQRRTLEIISAS